MVADDEAPLASDVRTARYSDTARQLKLLGNRQRPARSSSLDPVLTIAPEELNVKAGPLCVPNMPGS